MARFKVAYRKWPINDLPRPTAQKIVVTGFMNEPLGLGRAARLTGQALINAGYQVVEDDLRILHRRLMTRRPEPFPSEAPVWIVHANPPEARIALFGRRPEQWGHMYRVGYWVWETSVAPDEWLGIAKWFHEIWVPSVFVEDAFKTAFLNAGLNEEAKKVKVMPHPVLTRQKPTKRSGATNVLAIFDPRSDLARKNPSAIVQAWLQAFPDPCHARLTIKSHAEAKLHPGFSELCKLAKGRSDIEFRCETLDTDQTLDLIASADILISLHRGEGFGLSLAEAMAAGVPVIATGWSGNMQFMTPENSLVVPFALTPANSRHNGPRAQWAEPDVNAAAAALKQLCEDPEMRLKLGDAGQASVARLSLPWRPSVLFS